MFGLIFSLAFAFIALLFVGIGLLKGRRYVWTFSAFKCAAVVVSALLSALASILLLPQLFKLVFPYVFKIPALKEYKAFLAELPVLQEAVIALVCMIVAPLIFVVLFLILKAILNAVVLRISAAMARKSVTEETDSEETDSEEEQPTKKLKGRKGRRALIRKHGVNPLGMVCGAVCGALICFVLMVPLVGFLSVADYAIGAVSAFASGSVMETVEEISNDASDSIACKTVRSLGGEAIYDSLTTYSVGGERVSLLEETKFFATAADAIAAVKDSGVTRPEAASKIVAAKDAFVETKLLTTVIPDTLEVAVDHWEDGEDFLGMNKPSFGATMGELVDPTLALFKEIDTEIFKQDVSTIAQVAAIVIEQDVWKDIKSEPLSVLENKELSTVIIYEILCNDHMSPLIGNVADFGIDMLAEKVDAHMDGISMDTSSIVNKEAEAEAIAEVLGNAFEIMHYMEEHPSVDAQALRSIGTLLDSLAATQMAGEKNTDQVLLGLMGSEKVYSSVGFSKDEAVKLAGSINTKAHVGGYRPLMNSLGQTVEVIQISAKADKNNAEMDEKVEVLLQDLTPESAAVLQEVTSPTIMQNHGVPEKSAEQTSEMVSNMFGNLSEAKENGMSEEEYQKEAKATTDMLNLAMSAGKSESGTTFGEGSATGKSAEELLDNVLDSKVISQTMVETVYANGTEEEPVMNPLNSGKELQETEKEELLTALNNKWNQASEEEKASTELQNKYVAIGAMLNVPIQITNSGIVIA